jgi:hypothetical protein
MMVKLEANGLIAADSCAGAFDSSADPSGGPARFRIVLIQAN